jgi:hypothetical protein
MTISEEMVKAGLKAAEHELRDQVGTLLVPGGVVGSLEIRSGGCFSLDLIVRAVLEAALAAAPSTAPGDGWVLVPREPTSEMRIAGAHVADQRPSEVAAVYAAMLAAATPNGGRTS